MKLTVVQLASNNSSRKLVRSSNHSIRCHPRSSSFPSKNLHVVSSKISTRTFRNGWPSAEPIVIAFLQVARTALAR